MGFAVGIPPAKSVALFFRFLNNMRAIEVPGFVKALIFDCDGTLVDSMPLHMRAWEYVILRTGGPWDFDFFFSRRGTPERKMVTLFNAQFARKLDPVEILRIKHEYFWDHAAELKAIPHVVDVVRKYHGVLPMAVASGGIVRNVNLLLESIQLKGYFDVILSADDDIKPKPAPDIFLAAARQLGVEPEYCQVFEDGDLGLEAARLAGMLSTDIR
jgi:HAD superfamily hydrolase (TIGR01509 family)